MAAILTQALEKQAREGVMLERAASTSSYSSSTAASVSQVLVQVAGVDSEAIRRVTVSRVALEKLTAKLTAAGAASTVAMESAIEVCVYMQCAVLCYTSCYCGKMLTAAYGVAY
jgi:methylthioribose-1-phosphate isomerase